VVRVLDFNSHSLMPGLSRIVYSNRYGVGRNFFIMSENETRGWEKGVISQCQ
jgi:hypothetical protein